MKIIDIWITCGSVEEADRVAEHLITERLIACANRQAEVESRFFWDGAVQSEREVPLLVKTRADLFDRVEQAVRAVHSYDVPAIIALEVAAVNADFAEWVHAETRD